MHSNALTPLCGHEASRLTRRGFRLVCGECGSFWDLGSLATTRKKNLYNREYAASRAHRDPRIGANKVATMLDWLRRSGATAEGQVVCEVGFGAGYTLRELHSRAQLAFGVEAVSEDLDFAAGLGVPRDRMFSASALPTSLPQPISLWLFQDSFEHLPEPAAFLAWMARVSAPRASVLVVCPRADSLSRALMGPLWVHRVVDHRFHWSREGLVGFFSRHGYALKSEFTPTKVVSLETAWLHLLNMAHIPDRSALRGLGQGLAPLNLKMNFGELGACFTRSEF